MRNTDIHDTTHDHGWIVWWSTLRGLGRRYWAPTTLVLAAVIVISSAVNTSPANLTPPPSGSADRTYEVRGFLALSGPDGVLVSRSDTIADDSVCWGQSQYQDIALGVTVTVFDDHDRIVAEGALSQGRAPKQAIPADGACFFPIIVPDVPAKSAFYQVEVARRGTVLVENTPEDGVLYAFIALDDEPGSLPKVADQRPRLPAVVD